MKILFQTYYHAFQNPGGGEVVLLKSKDYLKKKGVEVELFNQWTTKITQFDLIHNFSTLNYRDWDGFKTYCPKLVVTPVLWPTINYKSIVKDNIKGNLKRILGLTSSEVNFHSALNQVDCFFPTTIMEKERLHKRFQIPNSKMNVIYNGVDHPSEKPSTNLFQEKYHLDDYYLFVGRISPLKNVHTLIEAVRAIGKKIVLIGNADKIDESYYHNLLNKYKHDSQVIFFGQLPFGSSFISDAYYGANALIVASHFETCSLVGLEAGIRGTPVIMTKNGATKEVYQDFVDYIDPENQISIIKALESTWSVDKKSLLAAHIQSNYSWDSIAQQLVNSYTEILNR